MNDEIDRLKARIAELELQLSIYEGTADDKWFLPETVGVRFTRQQRQIMRVLHERRGHNVLHYALEHASHLAGRIDDNTPNATKVVISNIRKKLVHTPWRIVAEWGLGYRLERVETGQSEEKAA